MWKKMLWKNDIRLSRSVTGDKNWMGENAPGGTAIQYYLGSGARNVALRIVNGLTRETVRDLEATAAAGLNRVQWDLHANPLEEGDEEGPMVVPGRYLAVLEVDGQEQWAAVDVLEDVWMR